MEAGRVRPTMKVLTMVAHLIHKFHPDKIDALQAELVELAGDHLVVGSRMSAPRLRVLREMRTPEHVRAAQSERTMRQINRKLDRSRDRLAQALE